MIDLHTHSKFSPDSTAEPTSMIEQAIKLGLSHFGITEHIDYDYVAHNMQFDKTDEQKYFEEVFPLKNKYQKDIKFLFGMEFGFSKEVDQTIYQNIIKKYPLDYVINSVHLINGQDSYFQKSFDGKTKKEMFDSYLENILASVNANYDFQIVGHIGYVSRYAPYSEPQILISEHGDILREIFKAMINKNLCLEINTSAKENLGGFLPNADLIKLYKDLGGENFSFASDAHTPENISNKYSVVTDLLASLGFKYFSVFEKMKEKKIKF